MTKQEKLEALIQKAIDNGWENGKELLPFEMLENLWPEDVELPEGFPPEGFPIKHLSIEPESMYDDAVNVEAVIYDKGFAKALFGKGPCVNGVSLEAVARMAVNLKPEEGAKTVKEVFSIPSQPMFEYHLQQAVIADDPIDYLYQAVFGGEQ